MSVSEAYPGGGFHRNADKAMLGGVCAGIADYLGFNLRVTRILAFICFLMAMPIALIAYFGIVFLTPSVSAQNGKVKKTRCRGRKRRERDAATVSSIDERETGGIAVVIDERCKEMDRRLARLEQHVTSKRFQLEQELRNL